MRGWLSAVLALLVAVLVGLALTRYDGRREPAPVIEHPANLPVGVPADAQRVEVRWVSDGDTVTVRAAGPGVLPEGVDTPVRLLEIDTPESKHPDLPVECFALEAAAETERLLPRGSEAWLQPDREPRDRFGRALAYVWNAEGEFVNDRLVREGFATAVYFRPNDRYLELVRAAEAEAREAGRGLWSACTP